MNKRNLAILAAIGATTIYGLNHTIAKGVMPDHVQPFGFIQLRVMGAALLFWLISLFGPKEKVERRDWLRFLICALAGMVINMLAFFKGLQLSTPINSAVIVTITPIIVVLLSVILIREHIGLRKSLGIFLGLIGALGLIFLSENQAVDAPNIPLGNGLLLVNAISYGTYLILVKKLMEKYHPFTLLKWLFTLGVFINLPFTYEEVIQIQWAGLPGWALGSILFVIVGTTFMTYLFNVFALTQLKASTVSAFVYAQPLIGIVFALVQGKDSLSLLTVLATILVLLGVYLASKKPKPGVAVP